MQRLTLKKVIAKNREALAAGTLGAQTQDVGEGCKYVYEDGSRCAIGTCLNKDTIKTILSPLKSGLGLNTQLVGTLETNNVVSLAGSPEKKALIRAIQRVHDAWANGSNAQGLSYDLENLADVPAAFTKAIRRFKGDVNKKVFKRALAVAERFV